MTMTNEEFVRTWQRCSTMKEFYDASGITHAHAVNRAARLRKGGVPLKRFNKRGGPRIDWEGLKRIAAEAAE